MFTRSVTASRKSPRARGTAMPVRTSGQENEEKKKKKRRRREEKEKNEQTMSMTMTMEGT